MTIEFIETDKVMCHPDDTTALICKPIDMFKTNAQCGTCPIITMCEAYEKEIWGECGEGWIDMTELRARMATSKDKEGEPKQGES